jgi:hypothetical protein
MVTYVCHHKTSKYMFAFPRLRLHTVPALPLWLMKLVYMSFATERPDKLGTSRELCQTKMVEEVSVHQRKLLRRARVQ